MNSLELAEGSSPHDATLVAQAMTRKVIVVSEDASLNQATRLMGEHGIRHLVVVDTDRIPLGVFSDRDVFRFLATHLARGGHVTGRMSVHLLMTRYPVTVAPASLLQNAAQIMDRKKIGCVLVVGEDRRLAGILTKGDVMRLYSARSGIDADLVNSSEAERSAPA